MKKLVLASLLAFASVPGAPAAHACHLLRPTDPGCWIHRANAFVITGGGTITPGLTLTPQFQSISFTGTATLVGTDSGTYACSFNGTDPAGSIASGAGTVSGACGPFGFTSCQFVRVGAVVEVVCVDGSGRAAEAVCGFTPIDVNPTTRYNLICSGAILG